MSKQPISLTLDQDNLLWLRGRLATGKWRSLSDVLDSIVTTARTGGHAHDATKSVVGTVDIAADDANLAHADAYVRTLVESSLQQPLVAREVGSRFPGRRTPRGKRG